MSWEDLSYARKGGVIALIISILIPLIFIPIALGIMRIFPSAIDFSMLFKLFFGVLLIPFAIIAGIPAVISYFLNQFLAKLLGCQYYQSVWISPGGYSCSGIKGAILGTISYVLIIGGYLWIAYLIGARIGKIIEERKKA